MLGGDLLVAGRVRADGRTARAWPGGRSPQVGTGGAGDKLRVV